MKKTVSRIYTAFLAIGAILVACCFCMAGAEKYDILQGTEQTQLTPVQTTDTKDGIREYTLEPSRESAAGDCLNFYTTHVFVEVYEDGELVYSLQQDDSAFGDTVGSCWNYVVILPGTQEILVRLQAAYENSECDVTFYQGNAVELCVSLIRGSLWEVIVSVLGIAVGVALFIYWFVLRKKTKLANGMAYFGIFALLTGLWTLNEAEMMGILIPNRVAASFYSYILLMLMIVPLVMFMREFLEVHEEKFSGILCAAGFLNAAVCTAMHLLGGPQFRQTIWVTHLLMGAAIVYVIYALTLRIRRGGFDRKTIVNIAGIVLILAAFAADLLAFYQAARKTDVVGRIGFLVYVGILAWEAARESVVAIQEGRMAAVYRELATKDLLTTLYNRNAYDEWAAKNARPDGTALVSFDLNNLKQCNDTLGHAMGDRYLRDAAKLIGDAFGDIAACYRIGGDEFCAVTKQTDEEELKKRLEKLFDAEERYNQEEGAPQMQIAHGYAIFDGQTDENIEATRNRADAEMYRNKNLLKGGSGR